MATLALGAAAGAVVVDNVAGQLEANTQDREVTSLTVTGTIDARDFKFIADSLTQLKSLDLSQAQIVAYSDSMKPLSGTFFTFPADELPATILMGTELDSLALPQSLKSIGHAALAGCTSLTTLELPASLTSIGSYAFSGTGLTQMTVPQSVTTIGEGAWAQCGALESISLNTEAVPAHAFMGDSLLASVTLGENVTTLGKSAFNGCSSLDSITLSGENNIATVGAEAFLGAGAQGIDLSNWAALGTIDKWAFATSGITSAAVPQGVTTMGDGAFYYADSLSQASLPAGVTSVPAFTFAGNNKLAGNFALEEGVESIGDYAFYNNDNISVFTVPASVAYVGSWAMAGMIGLDTVNAVPTVVPELGDSVWAGVEQSLVMLNTQDNDIADLYAAMEQWREFHILRNYLVGDVNLDGEVDVADVNAIIASMIGMPTIPFDEAGADLTSDGVIDVDDVNALISIILSAENQYVRKVRGNKAAAGNTTGDRLTLDDLSINAGGTASVTLTLNSMRDYSALQFDLDMPEGLSVVRATSLSSRHIIAMNDEGSRFILYSPSITAIEQGETPILTLTVQASNDVEPQGTITVTDLVLSTPQSVAWHGDDSYAQVSTVTGVNDVNGTSDRAYGYNGNIIIEAMTDGTAQLVDMSGRSMTVNVQAGRNEVPVSTGAYVVRLAGKSFKVVIR